MTPIELVQAAKAKAGGVVHLAARVDASRPTIYRWLADGACHMTLLQAKQIAKVAGVSLDDVEPVTAKAAK